MPSQRYWFAVALTLALTCTLALGDVAEETAFFKEKYGQELRKANFSASKKDDLELAARMLDDAQIARKQPTLVALICEEVYKLATRDPKGYPTAIAAMALLGRAVYTKQADCQQKMLSLYERVYNRSSADERFDAGEDLIDMLLKLINSHQQQGQLKEAYDLTRRANLVARSIRSLRIAQIEALAKRLSEGAKIAQKVAFAEAKLKTAPQDPIAKMQVIWLYVMELDSPAKAVPHLAGLSDEKLRKLIPLAAAGTRYRHAKEYLVELAEWYKELAGQADPYAKPAMLLRARAYANNFLAKEVEPSLERTKMTMVKNEVEAELQKLGDPAEEGWIDLVGFISTARHALSGSWTVRNGELKAEPRVGRSLVTIPVAPSGTFRVRGKFNKEGGEGGIHLVIPAGKGTAAVTFGGEGGICRIRETTTGEPAVDPRRRPRGVVTVVKLFQIANGRDYAFDVTCSISEERFVEIIVALDGEKFLYWKGKETDVKLPAELKGGVRETALGICTDRCTVTFAKLELRIINGRARLLK